MSAAGGRHCEKDTVAGAARRDAYDLHRGSHGDRPWIALLHGWSCSRHQWAAQLPLLVNHYNVLNLDLPGHGHAAPPAPGATTITAQAQYANELMRDLGITDVVVVGHSMGAAVAVEMARAGYPAVRAVIALDGLVHLDLYERQPPETVAAAAELLQDDYEGTVTRMFGGLIAPEARKLSIGKLMSTCSLPPQPIGIALYQGLLAWDMSAALHANQVPLAVICASHTLPREFRTRYGGRLDISPIAGVGHFLHMEEPEAINPLLLGTIDSFATSTIATRRPTRKRRLLQQADEVNEPPF